MKTITVRPMTFAEVADLTKEDSFYVRHPGDDGQEGALVKARLLVSPHPKEKELLAAGVPGFRAIPGLSVETQYGVQFKALASQVYQEDPEGTPFPLVQTVGAQVSFVLYAPEMEGPDVLARVRKALRGEFGPGVLQLRQETHRPVGQTGLPSVLGVPKGQVPTLI